MFALLFIPWFKLEPIDLGLPIAIQPFGLLVATGVLLGARMSEWRADRVGLRREVVSECISWVVGGGFILGHVFDTIFYHPQKILSHPWELLMPWTGMSSFGGFFGAVVSGFIWKWYRKSKGKQVFPLVPPLDTVAFGLSLGWFFGRMGCFVVHDHPGKTTDFFLAVADYHYGPQPYQPRHDLGLYEVFWAAACVGVFMWLQRKPRPHGYFIGMIAILYAPYRFMLDFLRVDDKTWFLGLTAGHYSSIAAFLLGVYALRRAYQGHYDSLPIDMVTEPKSAAAQ